MEYLATAKEQKVFNSKIGLSNLKSVGRWLYKYKLYHIPFWGLYHYIWWTMTLGPIEAVSSIFLFPVKYLFYVVFQAIAVYFNLYFLIPKYLEQGRYIEYISYLFLTIICTAGILVTTYYVNALWAGKDFQEMYGIAPSNYLHFFKANSLPSTVASTTLAMSIKLTKNWVQAKRKQQILEKEKLETELKFLKYQFNPHFLFNTINSIFFLIHKNPDMASASLAKFSDLLRYQLYECNDIQIPLTKEIVYLENFVELEKLRQNKNIEVVFKMDQVENERLGIAPFILMTFVENAFKHVSKYKNTPNWINIILRTDGRQLFLKVCNSALPNEPNSMVNYGGIGLKNVKRRLELLYQDQYSLEIENKKSSFEVRLHLELSHFKMPPTIANRNSIESVEGLK